MLQVATLLLLHKIIKYSLGTFLDEALSWMLGYKLRLETRSESLQLWGRKVDRQCGRITQIHNNELG